MEAADGMRLLRVGGRMAGLRGRMKSSKTSQVQEDISGQSVGPDEGRKCVDLS